jgi:hypothetical protein
MKKTWFNEQQIAFVLKQAEEGRCRRSLPEFRHQRGATFYIYGRLSRCKRLFSIPANLGANIYPASPGVLAHPKG